MRTAHAALSASFLLLLSIILLSPRKDAERKNPVSRLDKMHRPADHFYMQRAWPYADFDVTGYHSALAALSSAQKTSSARFQSPWTLQGPANIGGRINAVAIHPVNPSIMFVGCATGGIFRTTNAGVTWSPVFDDKPWLSIGDVEIDPSHPDTMYAGTGDPNVSGYPFIGDGIYRSVNGGTTWTHLGLDSVRVISEIIVHPSNSSILYVAAMGYPMARNNHRGLYKTTDGGVSWNQILFFSNQAGVIDIAMDPVNPQVIYATGWDRIRNMQESTVFGPASQIMKSTDGGATWNALTNGLPAPPQSRVNIAVAPSNGNILYAAFVDTTLNIQGFYKSTNAGQTWTQQACNNLDPGCLGGFGWYFARLYVAPWSSDVVFMHGIQLWRTDDGGDTWNTNDPDWWMYDVHADKHDMAFAGTGSYYLCTDGGMYLTTDHGVTWSDVEDIPNSQFYRVAVNPFDIGNYYGGLQDNGTTAGNASAMTSWPRLFGGDGFTPVFDPTNSSYLAYTTQNGGFNYSDDGGTNFFDFTTGIDPADRRNWDAPIVVNPLNGNVYYTGTYRMYKNTGGVYDYWNAVSNDITDGNIFGDRYHSVSCIQIDALDTNRVFAGTSDGNVWRTTDAGNTWTDVTNGLPNRYVTSVQFSPNGTGRVFATVSGYKSDDFVPHVHVSTNNGLNWNSISGDLPQMPVNDVAVLPGHDTVIAVATDAGVYVTQNDGANWHRVGTNMPVVPVYDIELDTLSHVLIAGTHARSLWTFPLDSLVPAIVTDTTDTTDTLTGRHILADLGVSVWPNPADEQITLHSGGALNSELHVGIFSLNGKNQGDYMIRPSERQTIPVGHLAPGVYILKAESQDGRKESVKFVKR